MPLPKLLTRKHRVPIVGFDGYEISKHGEVFTCWIRKKMGWNGPIYYEKSRFWRRLQPSPDTHGRLIVKLRKCYKCYLPRLVHLLVLEHFIGPRPSPEMDGCHNDGDHTNNYVRNLRWGTKTSNQLDRRKHGSMFDGERSHLAKLKDHQIPDVRRRFDDGEPAGQIACSLNVHPDTIRMIGKRKTWKHIAEAA